MSYDEDTLIDKIRELEEKLQKEIHSDLPDHNKIKDTLEMKDPIKESLPTAKLLVESRSSGTGIFLKLTESSSSRAAMSNEAALDLAKTLINIVRKNRDG